MRKFSQIEGLIIEILIHSAPSYEVQRVFSASNPRSGAINLGQSSSPDPLLSDGRNLPVSGGVSAVIAYVKREVSAK